jgi:hypothetical protein
MAEESPQISDQYKSLARSYLLDFQIHSINESRKELEKRSEWALAITGGMITALIVSGNTAPGHVLWQTKGLLGFLLLSSGSGLIARFMKLKDAPSEAGFPQIKELINLLKSGDASLSELKPGFEERWIAIMQQHREVSGLGQLTDEEIHQRFEDSYQWTFKGGRRNAFASAVDRKQLFVNLQLIFAISGIILYCLAVLLMF